MIQEIKTEIYFGGKTKDFTSKEEKAFEQKHLKAFLRGDVFFRYGYEKDEHGKTIYPLTPKWFKVKRNDNSN